jgi:hypothetical protein
MKKTLLTLIAGIFAIAGFAQDKLVKHSGETVEVKVVRVTDYSIVYKYPGEDAEQTIGKLAVGKITYASGRSEDISEKIVVNGKDDWEKVQIVEDKTQVIGLKKGGEIRGKTSGLMSYNTAGSADKKATRKLKEAAAELGSPFILMTQDSDARMAQGGLGAQGLKKGVAYTYK